MARVPVWTLEALEGVKFDNTLGVVMVKGDKAEVDPAVASVQTKEETASFRRKDYPPKRAVREVAMEAGEVACQV